jgi:hypothetical protein
VRFTVIESTLYKQTKTVLELRILEVPVKAEHDFYREKWQKEQNKTKRLHLTCDKIRQTLRGLPITSFE